MRKLLTTVLLFILCFFMFGNVYWQEIVKSKSVLKKQLIISKLALKKDIKLQVYIAKIDYLVANLSEDKLSNLLIRINKLPSGSNNYIKYKDFFYYLEAKISLQLLETDINNAGVVDNKEILESDYFIDNANLYKIESTAWTEFIIEYLGDDEYILKSKEGYYFFHWIFSWESLMSEQWDLYIFFTSKSGTIKLLINWIEEHTFQTEKELTNIFQIDGNKLSYIDGKEIIPVESMDILTRYQIIEYQDYFEKGEFYINSRIKSKEFRNFLQWMWDNIRTEYINKNKNIWDIYQINHLNQNNTKIQLITYLDYIHYFINADGYKYEIKWKLSYYGSDLLILENAEIWIVVQEDNQNILYINWKNKWIFNKNQMITIKNWKYFISIDNQEIQVEDFDLWNDQEKTNFELFTVKKLEKNEYREYIFNQ